MPVLVVDIANVMGSRPDGWWRDRPAAAARLLTALVPLAEKGRVIAITEGQARKAKLPDGAPPGLEVVQAPADGDTTIVEVARKLLSDGETPLVITADRGLKDRLPEGCQTQGPRWLLDRL